MKINGRIVCKACYKNLTANRGARCNKCLAANRPLRDDPKHASGRLCAGLKVDASKRDTRAD